jgi:hypothetical protein
MPDCNRSRFCAPIGKLRSCDLFLRSRPPGFRWICPKQHSVIKFPMLKVHWLILLCSVSDLLADQIVMRNGDTYHGTIVSMTTNVVVLKNENLGQMTLPHDRVAAIYPGATVAVVTATNLPVPAPSAVSSAGAPADLTAMFRGIRTQTNLVQQVKAQMLGDASPEALNKFNELLDGLSAGKVDLNGLRAEAQHAADQLRSLRQELGPEAGEATAGYLAVLDAFLKESVPAGTSAKTNRPSPPVK